MDYYGRAGVGVTNRDETRDGDDLRFRRELGEVGGVLTFRRTGGLHSGKVGPSTYLPIWVVESRTGVSPPLQSRSPDPWRWGSEKSRGVSTEKWVLLSAPTPGSPSREGYDGLPVTRTCTSHPSVLHVDLPRPETLFVPSSISVSFEDGEKNFDGRLKGSEVPQNVPTHPIQPECTSGPPLV